MAGPNSVLSSQVSPYFALNYSSGIGLWGQNWPDTGYSNHLCLFKTTAATKGEQTNNKKQYFVCSCLVAQFIWGIPEVLQGLIVEELKAFEYDFSSHCSHDTQQLHTKLHSPYGMNYTVLTPRVCEDCTTLKLITGKVRVLTDLQFGNCVLQIIQ